jgi:glycolate oxidase iron-sulfur subunit
LTGGLNLLRGQYDNLSACIRCGLCLSVCPTYQVSFKEEEGPRGRIAMLKALVEGHLDLTPDLLEHELNCLVCEACTAICPAGYRMEPAQVAFRAEVPEAVPGPVRFGLDYFLGDLGRLRRLVRLVALGQRVGLVSLAARTGLLDLLGLRRLSRFLPELPASFVVPRGQVWRPGGGPVRYRVALLTGCVMGTVFAEVTRATIRVLTANGCEVVAPGGQGCCGALHLHTGLYESGRRLIENNVRAFNPDDFDAIVVNSAGCGTALKTYDHYVAGPRAAGVARKTRDLTEFLDEIGLNPPPGEVPVTATYQDACHLAHAQRITAAPRRLLRAVPGLRLVEMAESALCCGSAGVYNLTRPGFADGLMRRKARNILATGAQLVITANPGCYLQLLAGLREAAGNGRPAVEVRFLAEVLDRAYRAVPQPVLAEVRP